MLRSWCALGSTSVAATMSFALGGMRIAAGGRRDHGSPAIHRQRNAYDAAERDRGQSRHGRRSSCRSKPPVQIALLSLRKSGRQEVLRLSTWAC